MKFNSGTLFRTKAIKSDLEPPTVDVSHSELELADFTISGSERFQRTVADYAQMLFEKSIAAADMSLSEFREVTSDNVKAAAHSLADSFGKAPPPRWMPFVRLLQYVCAGFLGAAANHLDKTLGQVGFASMLVFGTILYIVETSSANK